MSVPTNEKDQTESETQATLNATGQYKGINQYGFSIISLLILGAWLILFTLPFFYESQNDSEVKLIFFILLGISFLATTISVAYRLRNIGYSRRYSMLMLLPPVTPFLWWYCVCAPTGYAKSKKLSEQLKVIYGTTFAVVILLWFLAWLGESCDKKTVSVKTVPVKIQYYNDTDVSELKDGTLALLSTGQPVNGVVYRHHSNGNVSFETPYKDGKAEGTQRGYYESGKLLSETPYKDGIGIAKTYYESGELRGNIPQRNDKRNGGAQYYTESGRLLMKINWNDDNPVSGTCGDGRKLTNAELTNLKNGSDPSCNPASAIDKLLNRRR